MTSFIIRIIILVSYSFGNAALLFVDGTKNYTLYIAMRSIGQMALPLVCFLLVEGFYRTRDKRFYFIRLFGFGSAAIVPYWMMSWQGLTIVENAIQTYVAPDAICNAENLAKLQKVVSETDFAYYYDVFLYTGLTAVNGLMTVAMNLLMLIILDKIKDKYFGVKKAPYIILTTLTMLGTVFLLAALIPFEEPVLITLLTAMFYYLRGNKPAISVMMVLAVLSFYTDISLAYAIGAIIAVFIIYSYNGKEGSKKAKYFFYAYYPLHMLLLYFLSVYFVQ